MQNLYEKSVSFLKKQQASSSPYKVKKIEKLLNNLSKENIDTMNYKGSNFIIVNLKSYNNVKIPEYNHTYYKISFSVKDNEITSAFIYTIHTNWSNEDMSKDFQNIFVNKSKKFDGQIVTNDLNDRFIQAFVNKKGRVEKTYYPVLKPSSTVSLSSTGANTENCTDYYLLTTTLYADGHAEQDLRFLFQLCGGCNTMGQPVDHLEIDCDPDESGGGSGGDPGSNTIETNITETEIDDAEDGITAAAPEGATLS